MAQPSSLSLYNFPLAYCSVYLRIASTLLHLNNNIRLCLLSTHYVLELFILTFYNFVSWA